MAQDSYYLLSNLEIGDVILTNNENILSIAKSELQKLYTGGSFTHVMMCVSSDALVESVGSGVRFISPRELAFSDKKNLRVLRFHDKVEFPNLFTKGLDYYAFMMYNNEGIRSFINLDKTNINKVFCSELITEVYADYNVQLFDISPSQVTPESFENSNKFKIVTDECINEVSNLPDYISIIYDKENKIKTTALQIQEKSITNINKKIVKKYKEIIPNLQDSVELLGNYQNFKKKGIYQELLIQVKNNDNTYIEGIKNKSLKHVCIVIINLIKEYNLNTLESIDIFMTAHDKFIDKIFTEENYYNSHENFINAYKNIKVFDKTDSLNFSIEKKKEILNNSIKHKEDYSMIYNEQFNFITTQEDVEFSTVKKLRINLKKVNEELKKIIETLDKNISMIEKDIS
jgi:hypothetical protein